MSIKPPMTLWKTHPTLIMAESVAQRSPSEPEECMAVASVKDREKENTKTTSLSAKSQWWLLNITSPFGSTSLCQVCRKAACSLFKRKLKEKIS